MEGTEVLSHQSRRRDVNHTSHRWQANMNNLPLNSRHGECIIRHLQTLSVLCQLPTSCLDLWGPIIPATRLR